VQRTETPATWLLESATSSNHAIGQRPVVFTY
jgi:hypothetical protein